MKTYYALVAASLLCASPVFARDTDKLDLSALKALLEDCHFTSLNNEDKATLVWMLTEIKSYEAGNRSNESTLIEWLESSGLPIRYEGDQESTSDYQFNGKNANELQEIMNRMNEPAQKEAKRLLERLSSLFPGSVEEDKIRDYLEWLFALPWGITSPENLDIKNAQAILDADHYGLEKIKEHILDHIAVRNLNQGGRSPIICFVGPPGVGKTSLGKSIARCLGRKYVRISLAGIRNEADLRGHRSTYVGALPGKIIRALRDAGTCNPLIVLDEIDKVCSRSYAGDPAAALLEVLDPQQNKEFTDHYLGIPFDLSNVMFLTTANSLATMSRPLRDRLEIIHLSGYIAEEKMNIARQYLVPNALKDSGLFDSEMTISDDVLQDIIINYTREAGVRALDQVIRKLCSKAARSVVEKGEAIIVTCENIEDYLGPRTFLDEYSDTRDQVGITNGLCWTPYGGEVLKVETLLMPGKGKLVLTGQLGDVMQESARAALSYTRAHAEEFAIPKDYFTEYDLHIHVPAGAIKKDGPSAGVTMLTSIISSLTRRAVSSKYAMTGELNLRGEVMPIGGVKEKILAAKRNNIPYVIVPAMNNKDLVDVKDLIKGSVEIILVRDVREVLNLVLDKHASVN